MKEEKVYKGKWYTFYPKWSGFHISYNLAGYFDSRPQFVFHFIWGKLYLYLPWIHLHTNPYLSDEEKSNMNRKNVLDSILGKKSKNYIKKVPYEECDPPRYGVYYHERCFWFPYGNNKVKCLHLPWEKDWFRTSYMRKDKNWEHEFQNDRKEFWDKDKWIDILHYETHPYTYTLEDGTIQYSDATLSIVEREWRWRNFKWVKWIHDIDRSIDIEFSSPIGKHKGGTTGCSYTMLPNESPYDCLKRMEKERKFR